MPLLRETKEFLRFLQRDGALRGRIAARPDRTLIYAGSVLRPAWK